MNRKLLASAICMGLFVAGRAYAEAGPAPAAPAPQAQSTQSSTTTTAQDQKKKEKKPQELQTVTVTGTLLKSVQYEGTMPVTLVPIQASKRAGMTTVTQMIQSTAAAGSSTQINGQFGGFVLNGGTGIQPIDLRGLGARRTLVLLDGQRPGPAGTGGSVNDFDLNVIPSSIIQNIQIVKDGSSSIYGSDAIAGVVNLITKKRLDKTTLEFYAGVPQHGGGQQYQASIATGWNFSRGNITFAAQVNQQNQIEAGQRSFLSCQRPLVYGPNGNRVDYTDTSINAGTSMAGCDNLFIQGVIDVTSTNPEIVGYPHLGEFVPSPSGVTGKYSPVPGYELGSFINYVHNGVVSKEATQNQVNDWPGFSSSYSTVRNRSSTAYFDSNFSFGPDFLGPINWETQIILNRRVTNSNQWRQFFPIVTDNHGWSSADADLYYSGQSDLYEPVIPYPSNSEVSDDYAYLRQQLTGAFGNSSWTWAFNVHATQSDGDYSQELISNAKSGDNFNTSGNEVTGNTAVNYFDPAILSGQDMNQLIDAIGQFTKGHTFYKQQDANLVLNGNIFELPAGPLAAAVGMEYRHYSIDDQAPPLTWGYASAGETKGSDSVREVFGELGVPVVHDLPFVQNLSLDLSGREFRYNSVGKSSHVWKFGLNWQVFPTIRVRGSIGTSYRAPGLFELYLANSTGFLGQLGIDPCINWGLSSNPHLQANCAAAGIPNNYTGNNPSAEIISGGGKGHLTPETSRAKSLGIVWSPTFTNLNTSIDYFDYHIFGEINQLSASNILFSCYGASVFPNEFCNLFHRNPANAVANPNMVTTVDSVFININQERDRGYDWELDWQKDFGFGRVSLNSDVTYTLSHIQQLFSSASASGIPTNDLTGSVGFPRYYGIFDASLTRGDWTYAWQGIYVGHSSDSVFVDPTITYLGLQNSYIKVTAAAQLRQTVSAEYDDGHFDIIFGIRNVFDQTPPLMSPGDDQSSFEDGAQVASNASQYDWFGRTFFANLTIHI